MQRMVKAGIPREEALALVSKIRQCDHPKGPVGCVCGDDTLGGVPCFGIVDRFCKTCKQMYCEECTIYCYECGTPPDAPCHRSAAIECEYCGEMVLRPVKEKKFKIVTGTKSGLCVRPH